jgi:hypothetical protein
MIEKDNAENRFCAGKTCDKDSADDIETCCDERGSCGEDFQCPEDRVPKVDPALCILKDCDSDDCCDLKAKCGDVEICDTETQVTIDKDILCKGIECNLDDDEATCCESRGVCSEEICEAYSTEQEGFVLKDSPGRCVGAQSDPECNGAFCCDSREFCPSLAENACPDGMVAIEAAETTQCAAAECDLPTDSEGVDTNTCCEPKATCADGEGYQCSELFVLKSSEELEGYKCEFNSGRECDENDCCDARASCSEYECKEEEGKIAVQADVWCQGVTCEKDIDEAQCCENRGVCSDLVCSDDYYSQVSDSADGYCQGKTCTNLLDEDECCKEKMTCDLKGWSCGGLADYENYAEKPDQHQHRCADGECDEVNDQDNCCERRDTCDSMRDGTATTTCNTYLGTCQFGLRKHPFNIICSGSCTDAECCREETGEPLPETRPAGTSEEKDVLLYKTRVTGLSFTAIDSDEDLKKDLDNQFKPVFAAAAGDVDLDQITMIYAEGSLLVTAQVEAKEGEVLDSSKTTLPEVSDILEAVNTVPGIGEAMIPGETLSAAEPVGIRYPPANSSISAEPITPPTPPPPPSPTPVPVPPPEEEDEPSDEEEENTTRTSSAHTSVVGWQMVPLCIIFMMFSFVH